MTGRDLASKLTPWAGLLLGSFGWAVSHSLSAWVFDHCKSSWPVAVALVTIVGLTISAAGLWLSWTAQRQPDRPERFVAIASAMAAVGFILATLFHLAAALIIPRCLT